MSGTKGKGKAVNRTGLSDVFGVALSTIDSWVRQGCPFVQRGVGRGQPWKFNTADVAQWLRDKSVQDATGETVASDAELRRRKMVAETATAELTLAKAKGEVAPIREFERAQAKVFAEIRANIMNVPQRVVVQLLNESDETRFKQVLRSELTLALEAAANADLILEDEEEDVDSDS